MKIPFNDVENRISPFKGDYINIFESVLDEGVFILGENVKLFEKEFADFCNIDYCIGTGNGYDALFIIFSYLKTIDKNNKILITGNSYIATVLAVLNAGFDVEFIDIDEKTLNVDINRLEKIKDNYAAFVITHLYGRMPNMEKIKKICDEKGIRLIEDASQSHGAEYRGKRSGSWGWASAFSFYPTKNLFALGDGGAVITNDEGLYEFAISFRNYGTAKEKYVSVRKGVNTRLDELQSAILRYNLKKIDEINENRRKIANRYIDGIENPLITIPFQNDKYDKRNVWHLFVIMTDNREEFIKYMNKRGVQTNIHYPVPPYVQMNIEAKCPVTDRVSSLIVSLPLWENMTDSQVNYLIETVNRYE